MNHFNCIYMYINKINNRTYIGKAQNFNRRHKQHINSSYNENAKDYGLPFHRAIRKHGIENFEIKILKENLSDCAMNILENYYIEKFDSYANNRKGYNIASGGEGGNLIKGKTNEEKQEIRNKISKSNKGGTHDVNGENNPMYGKKGKDNPLFGRKLPEKTKQKMSNKSKNRTGINSTNHKSILQFDKNMNFIKRFEYINQASDELNISRQNISSCLREKSKTAGGFIWKYEKED